MFILGGNFVTGGVGVGALGERVRGLIDEAFKKKIGCLHLSLVMHPASRSFPEMLFYHFFSFLLFTPPLGSSSFACACVFTT